MYRNWWPKFHHILVTSDANLFSIWKFHMRNNRRVAFDAWHFCINKYLITFHWYRWSLSLWAHKSIPVMSPVRILTRYITWIYLDRSETIRDQRTYILLLWIDPVYEASRFWLHVLKILYSSFWQNDSSMIGRCNCTDCSFIQFYICRIKLVDLSLTSYLKIQSKSRLIIAQ